MTMLTKSGQNQVAKGLFLLGTVAHGNEMYGTMSVYLRLKGIVPALDGAAERREKKPVTTYWP